MLICFFFLSVNG